MRRNGLLKRTLIAALAFVLVLSNTLCLYADEVDNPEPAAEEQLPDDAGAPEEEPGSEPGGEPDNAPSGEPSEEASEPQDEEDQEEPEEQKKPEKPEEEEEEPAKVSKITASNSVLSFGTVTTSDSPRPLGFSITNEGETEVSLGWSQTDTTGIFAVNMPSNVSIPLSPGTGVQGSVEIMKGDMATGDYSTTLIFTDLNKEGSQAKIDVSIRIEQDKPKVTKVRISPGSVSVRQGGEVEFRANVEGVNNPDTGVSFSVNGQSSSDTWIDNTGTLHVSSEEGAGSLTVVAISDQDSSYKDTAAVNIAKNQYVVNADVYPSESGYVNGKGTFNRGDRTTLTAFPETGYSFDEWLTSDGEHVSYSASFTTDKITSDLKFKAKFKESGYEIKVKTNDKDMGTVDGGGLVDKGDSVTIEAKPKKGYYFYGWYEKDKLVSKDTKVKIKNVRKNHTYVAYFSKDKFVISVAPSPGEGGSVTGGGEFKRGESTVVKAFPASGYHFKGFVINNNVVTDKPEYKIKDIDRDLSVSAYFEKDGAKNHTIKSGVANKGGAISPSGETSVTEGTSITYAIAPDNGFGILTVAVDGVKIGAVTSYTFENVKEEHTISVAFAPKEDPVNEVEMDKIITTAEADAIAVDKLKKASKNAEGRESTVITPEEYQRMKEEEAKASEGDTKTLTITPEQNLIGMDDTDDLGDVVNTYNPDTAQGVYQSLDITRETAERLIDSGADDILINEAFELGYLDILINNEYVVPGDEENVLTGNRTVSNLQEIVRAALTKEDKLLMLEGKEVVLSFTISGAENPGDFEKEMVKGASGVSIDKYLYITLMKSVDGVPSLVEELDKEMEIVLEIPKEYRDSSKKFCLVRNHNGEVDVLEDLDNNPDTITVRTDRFSPYALGHLSESGLSKILVGAAVAIAILLLIVVIFSKALAGQRRR